MKNEKTENAGSQVHHKYKLQFPGETGTTILAIMHGPCTKKIRIAVDHFCLIFKVGASSVGATTRECRLELKEINNEPESGLLTERGGAAIPERPDYNNACQQERP